MKIYKKRGATFITNNKDKSFDILINEIEIYRKCCQEIYNRTFNLMSSNQISKRFFGSFCDFILIKDSEVYKQLLPVSAVKIKKEKVRDSNGLWVEIEEKIETVTTANLVKTIFDDIFKKYNFAEDGISNYKRSIVKHALDRIDSFITRNSKRNKDPKLPTISFKGKTLHISEGMNYDESSSMLTIPYSKGKLTIPIYKFISKGKVSKNFGGNFIFKYDKSKNIYCVVLKAAVDIVSEPAYKPTEFIGFDINQTPIDWIVFSDGSKISRPDNMSALIKQNNKLNKEISNKNKRAIVELDDGTMGVLRSKGRRKKRYRQIKVLSDIQKLTKPFAMEIINKAISEKKGIAIDKITPGANGNGEFGQYIANYVQSLCEDMGIPFYISPSAYTSRKCICGSIDKKNRDGDKFKCVSCGYTANSHVHAANNIRMIGESLNSLGIIYSGIRCNSTEDLIKKSNQLEDRLSSKNKPEKIKKTKDKKVDID